MSDQGAGPDTPPADDQPDGQASNKKWVWAIAAILIVIALLLLWFFLQDDDGDDDSGSGTTTSSSTSSTSTSSTSSSTTSTTDAPATTTTAGGTPPVTADPAQCRDAGSDPDDPAPAAEAVFVAWTRGDIACADELMTDDALDDLFARDGSEATDEFQGCTEVEDPDPATDCAFTYPGGSTHYLLNFSPTDGWQVFEVQQVAD
jgi:hypothetical protein